MRKNITRRQVLVFSFATLAAWSVVPALAQDPNVSEARRVALDWLVVVDAGNAAGSWNGASKRFQETMTLDQWGKALAESRGTFGKLKQRAMHDARVGAQFEGLPQGDYAVLQFRSTFEKRENTVETIVLGRETDGKWQVIGYSIR